MLKKVKGLFTLMPRFNYLDFIQITQWKKINNVKQSVIYLEDVSISSRYHQEIAFSEGKKKL